MSLLHLDSSAHGAPESVSRRLGGSFARQWCARHGDAGYRHRDLVADPVVPIGPAYCDLGRRVERLAGPVGELIETAAERQEWDMTRELVDELVGSDVLLIGAPMYNYGAPAALKTWIDRVSFPGAFIDPADGSSLLEHLRVVVVTACGGAYGPGTGAQARDFLTPHLRAYFVKQGVPAANLEVVGADRTLAGIVPGREHLAPLAARALDDARTSLAALVAAVGDPAS